MNQVLNQVFKNLKDQNQQIYNRTRVGGQWECVYILPVHLNCPYHILPRSRLGALSGPFLDLFKRENVSVGVFYV